MKVLLCYYSCEIYFISKSKTQQISKMKKQYAMVGHFGAEL